jgi:hypothetical protein
LARGSILSASLDGKSRARPTITITGFRSKPQDVKPGVDDAAGEDSYFRSIEPS